MDTARVAAVVLAAGLGARFGGGKARATFDGRALLQHVLDRLAEAGITRVVVVLGRDAAEVEASIAWRGERRVVNPRPERGLASSVRLGFDAATAVGPGAPVDGVLVALGDQPRVRPDVIRALLGAATSADRPFAVPGYVDGSNPNPVLVLRAAWPLVRELSGDSGFGPLLRAHGERVLEIPVGGTNPDIDTQEDLAALSRV